MYTTLSGRIVSQSRLLTFRPTRIGLFGMVSGTLRCPLGPSPKMPIEMKGGTTFHFVTDGPEAALEQARDVAGSHDINIGGGASTAQQYLRLALIDEMEVHVVPILLGGGERLFENLDGPPDYLKPLEVLCSPSAGHFRFVRDA